MEKTVNILCGLLLTSLMLQPLNAYQPTAEKTGIGLGSAGFTAGALGAIAIGLRIRNKERAAYDQQDAINERMKKVRYDIEVLEKQKSPKMDQMKELQKQLTSLESEHARLARKRKWYKRMETLLGVAGVATGAAALGYGYRKAGQVREKTEQEIENQVGELINKLEAIKTESEDAPKKVDKLDAALDELRKIFRPLNNRLFWSQAARYATGTTMALSTGGLGVAGYYGYEQWKRGNNTSVQQPRSKKIREIFARIERVANTDSLVFVNLGMGTEVEMIIEELNSLFTKMRRTGSG